MGQPLEVTLLNSRLKRLRVQTSGSKTFQYREEKRPIGTPLVAASETGTAQTQPQNLDSRILKDEPWGFLRFDLGEYKFWGWGL